MYRWVVGELEVLLVHPGGPFWANKEFACWTIPKGEYEPDEDAFAAAQREFQEETGLVPTGTFHDLSEVKQTGGKRVKAWAFEGTFDVTTLHSNSFRMEYPPASGQFRTYPEVDRAAWFSLGEAKARILKSQVPLLEELAQRLSPQTFSSE